MVSTHPKALTIARLRTLARLYRQGIEGVDVQLLALVIDRSALFADIVGFDVGPIDDGTRPDLAAERIVAAIESAPRRARSRLAAQKRQRAEGLARELADHATLRDDGFVDLDHHLLRDLSGCGGYRYLGLTVRGQVRVLERARLKAAFKECRKTQVQSLYLTSEALWLHYKTKKGHGLLCFRAERLQRLPEDVVVVPELAAPKSVPRAAHVVEAPTQLQPSPSVEATIPAVLSSQRGTSPFVHHFLDVLSEGLL